MKASAPATARILILLYALAWPLDAFTYVPVAGFRLTTGIVVAVVGLWAVDAVATRRSRPPFELVWPVAALAALAWVGPGRENAPASTIALLGFLAVAHFSPEGSFQRRYRQSMAGAGAFLAFLVLVAGAMATARRIGSSPPNYSWVPEWPGLLFAPTLASGRGLLDGSLTLAMCMLAALHGWRTKTVVQRISGGLAVAVPLLTFLPLLSMVLSRWRQYSLPVVSAWGPARLLGVAITVWLFARVTAKIVVHRRETGEGSPLTPAMLVLSCVAFLGASPAISPGFLLLAGLFAGGALPREDTPETRVPGPVIALPLIAVLALNLWHVYPANHSDPRNYEAHLRNDVREGRLQDAWRRTALVASWHSGELRTHWWKGRVALECGRPYLAARELAEADDSPVETQVLPPPGEAEIDAFLVRLRDYCSSLPHSEKVFAYEKALCATGREDAALALLRSQAAALPDDSEVLDEELLFATVRNLLGCEEEKLRSASIPAPKLSALLRAWGADVRKGAIPEMTRAATVVADFGVGEAAAHVIAGQPLADSSGAIHVPGGVELGNPPPIEENQDDIASHWEILATTQGRTEVRLFIGEGSSRASVWPLQLADDARFTIYVFVDLREPLPDAPSILVLLP